jgi:hypothetical protein
VLDHLYKGEGSLNSYYIKGNSFGNAYSTDYSFLIWGLIELYQATYEDKYLDGAIKLNNKIINEFWDDENDGILFYSKNSERLIINPREIYDGAIPSVNSVSAMNFIRLARLTQKAELNKRAKEIFDPAEAEKDGIKLLFVNSSDREELLALTDGKGFDDVFVYAPVPALVELADSILGFDGCLNFFAGPLDKNFSANFNFYNVHYAQHHVAGTSGSTTGDMLDIVRLIGEKRIDPAVMITHIGGLDAAINTTLHLPEIAGGKKLIYTHISLPLTALSDFAELGKNDKRFCELDRLVKENNGLWSSDAEKYLLENFK